MSLVSSHIDDAFEILDSIRGKPLTIQERKRLSIELASHILSEAALTMSPQEKAAHEQFSRLMADPIGKAFTAAMTDRCFRSKNNRRIADQLIHLFNQFGVPKYLPWMKRVNLRAFQFLGSYWGQYLVPFATKTLKSEASRFILEVDPTTLGEFIEKNKNHGIRVNLIRVGETSSCESIAKKRLETYLKDLENPDIEYLSIKISTLTTQINLIDFETTLKILSEKLRILYRAAMSRNKTLSNGKKQYPMITLDVEDYEYFHLTVSAFQKVLCEPEFHHFSAGIALQSYLPDSRHIQKDLTDFAKNRIQNGGAPIYLRIMKGAYLSLEQVSASHKNWPQTPYLSKLECDANFKRMVSFGTVSENARAVHLGIGTHNLFDIAYTMLLRSENQVESYVAFEILEGVVNPILHVINQLTADVLLYAPIASKDEFLQTISYLFRRLDENSSAENFLRFVFSLKPGTEPWENQTSLFSLSCDEIDSVLTQPRRFQNRFDHPQKPDMTLPFENDPPTDFSLPQNRKWAENIAEKWKNAPISLIPNVIDGKEILENQHGSRFDVVDPNRCLYQYAIADVDHLELAITSLKKHEKEWSQTNIEHRCHLLSMAAQKLRERRAELIGSMMIDSMKIASEADLEVSQAIDYAEYYRNQMIRMRHLKDIHWDAIGTVLVVSPWNFPLEAPACGIFAALMSGNCVLFKPSLNGTLVAWNFVNALWDAGIPREVLQFAITTRELLETKLLHDKRLNKVIYTGPTSTAQQFLEKRPDLNLVAETSGKNAIIVTAMADRELAIKTIVQSAFSYNGQKSSAAALAILEAEVYDDPVFLNELKESVASLKLGLANDLSTEISPLIKPGSMLKQALTSLDDQEQWLLEPKQDPSIPNLFSPGIKLHVKPGSFFHQADFFGPILGLMRAESLSHAIAMANDTQYALAASLISLDEREQAYWIDHVEAGNCFINRPTTGAIVRRQPFGGYKASSIGSGYKTGGPNYLREFSKAEQIGLPQEKHPVNESVNHLTLYLEKIDLSAEQLGIWYSSIANYAYWWKRLRQNRDPNKILGQDNFFRYVPRTNIILRFDEEATPLDALRILAAALTVDAGIEISFIPSLSTKKCFHWLELISFARVVKETRAEFCNRLQSRKFSRIRMVEKASMDMKKAAAVSLSHIIDTPPLANGRIELLHYLRELSVSIEYHRYGNLGIREGELRKPLS